MMFLDVSGTSNCRYQRLHSVLSTYNCVNVLNVKNFTSRELQVLILRTALIIAIHVLDMIYVVLS